MNDQRSVTDQMRDLIVVANREGLYDASDWIVRFFPWPETTNGGAIGGGFTRDGAGP